MIEDEKKRKEEGIMRGEPVSHERTASDVPLLGLLAMLYFAQGLPSGLLGKALPPLLREHGVSLSAIGFTAMLALPWTLKFLWAPFLDRFWTRRRWLLTLNLTTCGLMLLVAARDFGDWVSQSFALLMTVLFLMNLVAATQDIATDGLAVSRLAPRLRGLGNSVQVIGYKIGMIVGGGLLLWLVAGFGWKWSYTALALLIVPVLLPVWFMREPSATGGGGVKRADWQGWHGYVRLFADFVSRPRMGWWLFTVATFKAGDSLASRMIGPMLSDQGLSLADIGLMTGVVGATAGLAGALLGGLFLLRLGHRKALLLFGGLQAAGFIGYYLVAAGACDAAMLYAVICMEQFADGLSTVALFTSMMDACRQDSPGTDYTLQAALQVAVSGFAALASGLFAQTFGYQAVFAAGAAVTLCSLVPVVMYFRAERPRPRG
ncbi:MAG TPA: MFS transporter [Syntrophales bacterium]|nr:MFS transporter [Syntrophales bacterium]HOX94455.1 MFS transporter [Syntrophales bacterium]HPI56735.1 MFS transporter [Syntrophales bacterium]HPN24840.1 MFS transporter [Syntrophales bacterium]HQM30275.1 MFS transporter [Syntrophales bacterium]